mmetsp:Transcript_90969/g.294426  ORF Transcript_90969/g.294426 Transcript_90969/m.294426 type:complete len:321 (-) Transcript_90969:1609-2571(-)
MRRGAHIGAASEQHSRVQHPPGVPPDCLARPGRTALGSRGQLHHCGLGREERGHRGALLRELPGDLVPEGAANEHGGPGLHERRVELHLRLVEHELPSHTKARAHPGGASSALGLGQWEGGHRDLVGSFHAIEDARGPLLRLDVSATLEEAHGLAGSLAGPARLLAQEVHMRAEGQGAGLLPVVPALCRELCGLARGLQGFPQEGGHDLRLGHGKERRGGLLLVPDLPPQLHGLRSLCQGHLHQLLRVAVRPALLLVVHGLRQVRFRGQEPHGHRLPHVARILEELLGPVCRPDRRAVLFGRELGLRNREPCRRLGLRVS